jgi:DNA-binding NarL/FixJ family response regulator
MPEIVLMDICMPILDGIQVTTRRVESGTSSRILILTTFGLDEYALGALRAGASGFVLEPSRRLHSRVTRRH